MEMLISIVRTIFEAEAEPRILPSASDRAKEAQTRILPLAIQNCPDYCYFRVGYCPILIEGNFAIAKTLLYPGYKKTPEYGCLMSSSLAESQKAEMLVKATKQDVASLRETNDFSCVQWFHNNGVPQVIQTREEIFAHVETMMPIMDLFRS